MADIPIPGNDDSMRSIDVVLRELNEAITEGKLARGPEKGSTEESNEQPAPSRRSSRSRFRADEPAPPVDDSASEAPAATESVAVADPPAETPPTAT